MEVYTVYTSDGKLHSCLIVYSIMTLSQLPTRSTLSNFVSLEPESKIRVRKAKWSELEKKAMMNEVFWIKRAKCDKNFRDAFKIKKRHI